MPGTSSPRAFLKGLWIPTLMLTALAATPLAKVFDSDAAAAPAASTASVPAPAASTASVPAPAASTASLAAPAQAVLDAAIEPATAETGAPLIAGGIVPAVETTRPAVLAKGAQGLSPKVLAMALDAMECAQARGVEGRDDLLTVIDYSLPSTQPRLWVLDLERGDVLYRELVAHGRGTGENYATRFSNKMDSHQTSLGLFLTGGTYEGGNGYSLRLKGLDEGFNDRAEERHIVMHGAWYVSEDQIRSQGRLGRSWGCPALSQKMARPVIDDIKGGSFVFAYGKDSNWIRTASSNSCGTTPGGGSNTMALAAQ